MDKLLNGKKKQVIGYIVALVLGALGGFFGKDLSGYQKPVETAVEKVIENTTEVTAP